MSKEEQRELEESEKQGRIQATAEEYRELIALLQTEIQRLGLNVDIHPNPYDPTSIHIVILKEGPQREISRRFLLSFNTTSKQLWPKSYLDAIIDRTLYPEEEFDRIREHIQRIIREYYAAKIKGFIVEKELRPPSGNNNIGGVLYRSAAGRADEHRFFAPPPSRAVAGPSAGAGAGAGAPSEAMTPSATLSSPKGGSRRRCKNRKHRTSKRRRL